MIIIDSDNYAEHGIQTMFFPGGEPHIKVPIFKEGVLFYGKLRTWNDVAFAALLTDAMSHQSDVEQFSSFIPYFPGARQDRTDGTAALTVEVMIKLLADGLMDLVAFDPHSRVLEESPWLDGFFMPSDLSIPIKHDVVGIIAPDAGAIERAESFRSKFYPGADLIECSKHRDSASGRLSGYKMSAIEHTGRYIIVDDICDGGGTFNLLVDAFNEYPASEWSNLEMFVSHGIFSKSIHAIDSRIEHITTTDSWCTWKGIFPERLTVIELLPQLLPKIKEIFNVEL